jgi:hypothetical protein
MAKYVEDFNEWALGMYTEYKRISATNLDRWRVHLYADKGNIRTILIDLKKGKCGSTRVSGDEYKKEIGIGVAWARLRGYEVPKERKKTMLKNLADYDKFNVITLENMDLIKIGSIPETKDIAVYDIKKEILLRLNGYTMVYKIN